MTNSSQLKEVINHVDHPDSSPKMPRITESIGDIFDAPPNSVLIRTYPFPAHMSCPLRLNQKHPGASINANILNQMPATVKASGAQA